MSIMSSDSHVHFCWKQKINYGNVIFLKYRILQLDEYQQLKIENDEMKMIDYD